jgi:hypothetical protein
MNGKRMQQVSQAAAPHLQESEQIEISAYANIGRVSVKRRAATAAAVGVATGGLLLVSVRPRKAYLAMTNQRLVFLDGDTMSGRPGKLLLTLPRSAVTVSDVKKGVLTLQAELVVEGQDQGLRIVFPKPAREDGQRMISALGTTAPPERP